MPQFTLIVDAQPRPITIPPSLITDGEAFFAKLDADMAQGWQMGRQWVAQPDLRQRCQIVADKLLAALESKNERYASLLAAYLLNRLPQVEQVEITTQGELQDIHLQLQAAHPGLMPTPPAQPASRLSKLAALDQASKEISKVYHVGKSYRYAVYDYASQSWCESGACPNLEAAERQRMEAYRARFEALLQA